MLLWIWSWKLILKIFSYKFVMYLFLDRNSFLLRIEISDESGGILSYGWASESKPPDNWSRMYNDSSSFSHTSSSCKIENKKEPFTGVSRIERVKELYLTWMGQAPWTFIKSNRQKVTFRHDRTLAVQWRQSGHCRNRPPRKWEPKAPRPLLLPTYCHDAISIGVQASSPP